MLIIGHRGACGYEPENTILSFKKALEIGVDMIEFDVRKTADGKIIIMHDATVDRTTNGFGAVENMTFEEIRKLDAGKGQKIPTLSEVLDFTDKKAVVDIEIKTVDAVQDVAKTIQTYIANKNWKDSDFLVSSFEHSALHECHQLILHIKLMALFSKLPTNWLNIMKELPAQMMAVSFKSISQKIVEDAHNNEISVIVYTVNSLKEIKETIELGIDGICSDYPDRVKMFESIIFKR